MPSPTAAGDSPTERVRNTAQLVYHAPLPTLVTSAPSAIRRTGPRRSTPPGHIARHDRRHIAASRDSPLRHSPHSPPPQLAASPPPPPPANPPRPARRPIAPPRDSPLRHSPHSPPPQLAASPPLNSAPRPDLVSNDTSRYHELCVHNSWKPEI